MPIYRQRLRNEPAQVYNVVQALRVAEVRPVAFPIQMVGDSEIKPYEVFVHYTHALKPMPLCFLQGGWMATRPGYGYGPMVRDHHLIHFIRKGEGIAHIQNKKYNLHAGQCFLIRPHQIAYYESSRDDPWEYYWLGFEGENAEELTRDAGFGDIQALNMPTQDHLFGCLDVFRDDRFDPGQLLLFEGVLRLALHYLTHCRDGQSERLMPHVEEPLMGNEYVRIVMSIITTSYREQVSVQEIANKLGLNRCYLTELFRRHTGTSIKECLTDYRIEQAKFRLQNSDCAIKRIALECGFGDPMYFSRVFHAKAGVSPMRYRVNISERSTGSQQTSINSPHNSIS